MTKEEAKDYIREWCPYDRQEEIIKALEQEPCGDAISRQAVIDTLHSKFADGFNSDKWWNSMSVLYVINRVPSVNPTKTGRWWERDTYPQECECWDCSECQETVFERTNYCPNCGAKMVEPRERSEKE